MHTSSNSDRAFFLVTIAVIVVFGVVLALEGGSAEMLETLSVPIAIWFFAAWELGRWRMRRMYPLTPRAQAIHKMVGTTDGLGDLREQTHRDDEER